MQIMVDESIGEFVSRLEQEANARMTLVSAIRKMMLVETVKEPTNGVFKQETPHRVTERQLNQKPTLAENIHKILDESPTPLSVPELRDRLILQGHELNKNNPLPAISTALRRHEGKLFERGNGTKWLLRGKQYAQPLIDGVAAVSVA